MSYNHNIIYNKYLENIGDFIDKNENNDIFKNLNINEKLNYINNNSILLYFFIFIVIFVFFNKFEIKQNHIFSLFICMIIFMFLLNNNIDNTKDYYDNKYKELELLNKYLFNNHDIINDYSTVNLTSNINFNKRLSYFYLDPYLTNLLYNLKELKNYNSNNYGRLLLHCNNILLIKNNIKIGIQNPWYNYENAQLEKKKALNNLQSILFSVPNNLIIDNKINNSLNILHQILNKHLNDILNYCNIEIRKNNYNINSVPTNLLKSNSIINPFDNKDNVHQYF